MRVGLADAATTNRFLLWGTATGCCTVGIVLGAVIQGDANPNEFVMPVPVMICYAGFGLTAAISFWLAFLPPARYLAWIARRAEASA